MEVYTQYSQTVCVLKFFGIHSRTGENYLKMLHIYVVPYLAVNFPDINQPGQILSTIRIHHDGVGSCYFRVVRNFLNKKFSNRWIARSY